MTKSFDPNINHYEGVEIGCILRPHCQPNVFFNFRKEPLHEIRDAIEKIVACVAPVCEKAPSPPLRKPAQAPVISWLGWESAHPKGILLADGFR